MPVRHRHAAGPGYGTGQLRHTHRVPAPTLPVPPCRHARPALTPPSPHARPPRDRQRLSGKHGTARGQQYYGDYNDVIKVTSVRSRTHRVTQKHLPAPLAHPDGPPVSLLFFCGAITDQNRGDGASENHVTNWRETSRRARAPEGPAGQREISRAHCLGTELTSGTCPGGFRAGLLLGPCGGPGLPGPSPRLGSQRSRGGVPHKQDFSQFWRLQVRDRGAGCRVLVRTRFPLCGWLRLPGLRASGPGSLISSEGFGPPSVPAAFQPARCGLGLPRTDDGEAHPVRRTFPSGSVRVQRLRKTRPRGRQQLCPLPQNPGPERREWRPGEELPFFSVPSFLTLRSER